MTNLLVGFENVWLAYCENGWEKTEGRYLKVWIIILLVENVQ